MNEKELEHTLDAIYRTGPMENALRQAQTRLAQTLDYEKSNTILYTRFEHPIVDSLYLAMRSNKLIGVDFGVAEKTFITHVEKQFGVVPYRATDELSEMEQQIRAYLDGDQKNIDIPIDISQLTNFQQQVLFATLQIPRGKIATYMDIARRIGNPKAVRAVGQALGRNPVPIVIPCHRVIASNGSLGGYSGGGGLETKARLLQLEGARLV
jgi:methylated-DNA-[protein]-cysteine S-methyltransferase